MRTPGPSLLKKMSIAIPKAIIHHRAFMAFTDGLKVEHEAELVQWEQQIREWEQDHSKPCPYDLPEASKLLRLATTDSDLKV
jgi:hypothetical protein